MTDVDDSLLKKFAMPTAKSECAPLDEQDVQPPDYQAYGIDSQVRPSNAMIDFWLVDGNQRAFAYTHLYDAVFDPSEGLTLSFSGHVVTVRGRLLSELYRGLKRHRVVYIWEADPPTIRLAEAASPIVTKIIIQSQRELFDAA